MNTKTLITRFAAPAAFIAGALMLPAFALAAQVTVSLGAGAISPSTVSVQAGDTVVWSNTSSSNQSVAADNGSFSSGQIAPGASFAATFNQTGTYDYYDNASGGAVVGEVIVGAASANTSSSVSTSATASTASLTAEIQTLLAQVNALESKIGAPGSAQASGTGTVGGFTTANGSCPSFTRTLGPGVSGNDVSVLQQFLAHYPSIYPSGLVTGYYGSLTEAAVEAWQSQNGIVSSGSPSTTGYGQVGPQTAASLSSACNGGSGASAAAGGVVSGFLQVSPVSGNAPLNVNVTATINTANSCVGGTYVINFGDGSPVQQIVTQSGNCSQQSQTFSHTYSYGGTYQITLSAGSHQSSATVTVSGSSAPAGVTQQQTTSGTSVTTTAPSAAGSITSFTNSGPAPLNVNFYVSCTQGVAYDVVFGDGQELGGSGVSQSKCDGSLQSVTHTYTSAGNYQAQLVVFTQNAAGGVGSQVVATDDITATGASASSSSSGSSSSTLAPMTVYPNQNGNPLATQVQFDPSSCTTYSLSWGDGTAASSGSCNGASGTVSHTYTQGGTYTISLTRDSQTQTAAVTITS